MEYNLFGSAVNEFAHSGFDILCALGLTHSERVSSTIGRSVNEMESFVSIEDAMLMIESCIQRRVNMQSGILRIVQLLVCIERAPYATQYVQYEFVRM